MDSHQLMLHNINTNSLKIAACFAKINDILQTPFAHKK